MGRTVTKVCGLCRLVLERRGGERRGREKLFLFLVRNDPVGEGVGRLS